MTHCENHYHEMSNPSLLLAQSTVLPFFPAFISNTRVAPEDVRGINLLLDLQQPLVILTPESLLIIRLVLETL